MRFPYYSVLFHFIITYILDLIIESQCSDNIWLFKAELNPAKIGLWANKTPFLMLKHTPKYLMSKATTLTTKLGGSKKRLLLNKIKLTREKKTLSHCKACWTDSFLILFTGLLEIIAQSALGLAIPLYWMYVEVVRKRVLCEFLRLGILSSAEKGTI